MPYTVGIEQEFFVVNSDSLDCVSALPGAFFARAQDRLGSHVCKELMGSMIELVSGVHTSSRDAVDELMGMRTILADCAEAHGLSLLACGTHPFSDWKNQARTSGERYDSVAAAMAGLTQRAHVCGIHVHVGMESLGARIDVMNRFQSLLPMLLAVTASSPLWRGKQMGVESYRTIGYGEGPRTGLPGRFPSADEYRRLISAWTEAGILADESYCWWWVRPSRRYETLEIRIADSCVGAARIELLVALCRASVHYLARQPSLFRAYSPSTDTVIRENLWQAARFGWDGLQLDAETLKPRLLRDHTKQWIERIMSSAEELGEDALLRERIGLLDQDSEAAEASRLFAAVSHSVFRSDAPARQVARYTAAKLHGAPAAPYLGAA